MDALSDSAIHHVEALIEAAILNERRRTIAILSKLRLENIRGLAAHLYGAVLDGAIAELRGEA